MKFHKITLRDFRAIRLLTLEPAETGVTIIQGENEIGKSSIAEALWLIFEQHDDSASKAVSAVRPVDRDVASEIEVDVSTGPYRFTFFKRFHRGARTELRIKQPRTEVLTGREADNRARQILGETIDVALWKALRFQQGVSDELEQLPAGEHQSLLSALDAASDLLGGEREQTLFDRVQAEYDRYYTASGREKNAGEGQNAARLRRARDEALTTVEGLTERIITLEGRAIRAALLEKEIEALESRRAALVARSEELAAADATHRRQATVVEALSSDLRACEASLREATAAHEARSRDAGELAPRTSELESLRAELADLEAPIRESRAAMEAARVRLADSEQAQAEARAAVESAEEALHLAGAAFTAQTMAERLERLETNEPELQRLREWLARCSLDARGLGAINAAEDRLKSLDVRRKAEGATVEISALDGLDIEINGRPMRIDPGQTRRGPVLGEGKIVLPGGITITVRAGTAARELEAQATRAQGDLDRLLQAAGVDSAAAAEDVLRQRAANEATLTELEKQLAADLRDLSSVEELRQKLARERQRIEGARATGSVPSIEEAKATREAAGQQAAAAEAAWKAARRVFEESSESLAAHERGESLLSERVAQLEREFARLAAALEAARGESSDDDVARRLTDADAARMDAAGKLDAAREELSQFRDVSEDVAGTAGELRSVQGSLVAMSEERAQIRGVLEDAGAHGLHGQLTDAEQNLAGAEDELESYLRRANAARTLYEAMKRHRDAAKENYSGPLRHKIEALGKLAYGQDFGVDLADDLRVVRCSKSGITLDVAQLSTGMREQLSVLTRLACASLVSEGGGAPLVLDDIFGWADPKRLRALGPILATAAAETQVLLFTCTPGRFESVTPARVISLPSGQREERGAAARHGAREPRPAHAPVAAAESVVDVRLPVASAPQPQAAFDLFLEGEPAGKR